jgi:uncharacterized protein (TIGR00270 family)
MNMNQEDFAKKLNLRLSMLHQIESEHFKPDVETAKRLEHALHINIIEEISNEDLEKKPQIHPNNQLKSNSFTLGDMIKVRRKK